MDNIKLKSGTILPLMNLKGKAYLQVAYRLVWFREEHPDWSIETEFVYQDDKSALCKATIKDASNRIMATGHKEESSVDFKMGHREKAETGAIGRALGLCGYGTQFEPDFDEGDRIVDSPIATQSRVAPSQPEIGDGTQRYGYPMPQLSKDAVEAIGMNPAGKYLEDLHKDTLHKIIDFLDSKYAGRDLPPKTLEIHERICARIFELETNEAIDENSGV